MAHASTKLFKGILRGQPTRTKVSEVPRTIIVSTRLLTSNGTMLGRYSTWWVMLSASTHIQG